MPILTTCSSCKRQLQVPEELLGRLVKCPGCGNTFSAAESAPAGAAPPAPMPPPQPAPPPPPIESIAENRPPRRPAADDGYAQGSPGRRNDADAYDDRDDRDDRDRLPRRPSGGDGYDDDYDRPIRRGRGLSGLSNEYSIDVGQWFEYGKEHYTAVLGPMIGFILLNVLVGLLQNIPFVGFLIMLAMLFLNPALQAGYAIVALAQLKGKRWEFGDFFSGFNWYGALLGNFWLTFVLFLVCMLPAVIAFFVCLIAAIANRNPDVLWVALLVFVVNLIPATYPILRLTCFNVQLIVDRDCGPIEAMKGSWQLSAGHFWGILGVGLLFGLMMLGGALLCGIGALFVAPFVIMAGNAGYLIIIGEAPPRRNMACSEEEYYDDRDRR